MKKLLINFADSLLSREQMKKVKGGYGTCSASPTNCSDKKCDCDTGGSNSCSSTTSTATCNCDGIEVTIECS